MKKLKLSKLDVFFIVSTIILLLISLFFVAHPETGSIVALKTWENWVKSVPFNSALLITVLITIIGNLSPFPSPYVLAVFFLSSTDKSNLYLPALIALISSFGALIGEAIAYLIGAGIKNVAKGKNIKKVDELNAVVKTRPGFVYFLIYFMALTPLPDKVVMIPVGISGLSFKKSLFSCWLGKFSMLLIIGYAGFFGLQWIEELIGGGENWVSGMVTIFIIILAIYLIFKVDLSRFAKKIESKAQQ